MPQLLSEMKSKKCGVCEQSFQRSTETQRRWNERKFCSHACWSKSRIGVARLDLRRRFVATCQACGKPFEAGGRTGRTAETMFCSRKCAQAARWRTGSKAKSLTTTQAAYLAGVIDGEGSIFLYERSGASAMRITVANTNRDLLEWCLLTAGVGSIVVKASSNPKHEHSGMWLCNSQAAASVLEQVVKYLTIKKEQARMAIDFQRKLHIPAEKAQRDWQHQWRERMKSLNLRGPTVEVILIGSDV